MKQKIFLIAFGLLVETTIAAQQENYFEDLSPQQTGITFRNDLDETPTSNVLTYEYFYNGGGVAIGDINNDGLEDIYFTGNMRPNALYLNLGNLKFKDITQSAGVACKDGWKTGVVMADVNADGYLDIYVCHSGKGDPRSRRNKLFINNGDLTFTDKSTVLGLDNNGYTTHASFFDYDHDGDIDVFILNHNVGVIKGFEFEAVKDTRHPYAGDKLLRNDNGVFKDVSIEAGIKGSPLGFGLGVTVSDVNQDGWPDIYVSNDYVEPDYLYINNKDGTYSDRITEYVQHLSFFSMGSDVSDINNDGWADIYTMDMLPKDNKRQKLLYGPENYEQNALMVENGFYFQNMRNMLHLNNADGSYSEIGQFSGISNTDWSWAPLLTDFDNDGWKDLFVANGYYRDYTNQDFLKFKGNHFFKKARRKEKADTFALVTSMSSTPLYKYIFKNNGDLTFVDKSKEWGFMEKKSFSSGCAYADLDNDGDMDLVVSNLNDFASLHRNMSRERNPGNHYISLVLIGTGQNTQAIGSKIHVYAGGKVQYFEKIPTKGFQSSVTQKIHVGLGQSLKADSVIITWPDDKQTVLVDLKADQIFKADQRLANRLHYLPPTILAASIFTKTETVIPYEHREYGFNDFKRQPLLLTMLTVCGPVLATGDVNGDNREDVFVGGTQENPGKLYIQDKTGHFQESSLFNFKEDRMSTDADALFVDVDGDHDLDLYVVSGGYNMYEENDPALQDRLYLNTGTGEFKKAPTGNLPDMRSSKSCISSTDFDHDGDMDLFVGGRVIPGQYPITPESFLLENLGDGRFENVTPTKAKGLSSVGMVTDSEWCDINKDGWIDLVVIGEFMGIEIFLNKEGKNLELATETIMNKPLTGFWTELAAADFDHDGDMDLIAGNFGLNSQLKASEQEPIGMIYKDFDNNGSVDPILTSYIDGKPYPFASRDELLDQIYALRSKFTSYASYADAQVDDIFSPEELKDAESLYVNTLESVYLENRDGKLVPHSLPREAQFSPVNAIHLLDFNDDGNLDFILGGNSSSIRIRMGVIDANYGQLFQGNGKGQFNFVPQTTSGLKITGDMKSLGGVMINDTFHLLVGINNFGIETYKMNSK